MLKNVDDIYPLTPLQQGMLFHAVADGGSVYVEQLAFRVEGDFDLEAFRSAWEQAIERHTALRTLFLWENLPQPIQAVRQRVTLPWTELDWRDTADEEIEQRLEAFLAEDRRRGFDVTQAPLMRMTAIQLGDETFEVVCSNHHLIFDGWSRATLFREVLALYEGLRSGQPAVLPRVRPYRDFVAWLQEQDGAAAERMWRREVGAITAPTPLPFEADLREPDAGGGAESVVRELGEGVTSRLQRLCTARGATMATAVQAAWAVLLARHSGQSEVVFGTTVSGRPAELSGVEQMVGLFINTLPVRIDVSDGTEAGAWLEGVQEHLVALREFEHTPLAQVQSWSGVGRGRRLFASLVVVENHPVSGSAGGDAGNAAASDPGQVVSGVRVADETDVPLTLVAAPGRRLELRLLFRRGCCTRDEAAALLEQLECVFTGLVDGAEKPLENVGLLDAAGEFRVAQELNAHRTALPEAVVPVAGFAEQAEVRADAVALVSGDRQWTYRRLLAWAGELAGRLRAQGVGPEDCCGVWLDRSAQQVVAALAVQVAGGAYVPLDAALPVNRVERILGDGGCRTVMTVRRLWESLGEPARQGVRPILLDEPETARPDEGIGQPVALARRIRPRQLAYVIYTSGSTGTPKGVLVEHHQVARLFSAADRHFGFTSDDVWSLFHSMAFDVSVWELFGALTHGARLVLVDDETRRQPGRMATLLREQAVTILSQTPSAFTPLAAELERMRPTGLKAVVFAGEALAGDRLARWASSWGSRCPDLINMYGITETTVHTTYHRLAERDLAIGGSGRVGRALPDLAVYLLDPRGRQVPPGVTGEICVAGPAVTRGYHGRPGLTADRYRPDPYAAQPGARMYRSGDLARADEESVLHYLGRADQQVKLRGYRIEPGEIEQTLRGVAEIEDAHVQVREDEPGARRLVAYLVAADPHTDAEELVERARHAASTALPSYMLPATHVVLPALPLTPNGKIDSRALPAPSTTRQYVPTAYQPPQGPVESRLAELWSSLLHVDPIGRHDNFFTLGGDSIISMQVAAQAGRLGLRLTPRDLFAHQTIAELAAVAATPGDQADDASAAAVGMDGEPFPLTPVQHWFFEKERPAPHHFNQSLLLRPADAADPELLRSALRLLVLRHPAMRLRFTRDGAEWQQEIAGGDPAARGLLREVDLRAVPADERAAAFAAAADEVQSSIDLGAGLLLKAAYFKLGEEGDRLLLVLHHLAVDGVSWRLLLEDLGTIHGQLLRGESPSEQLDTPTSFDGWARALAARANSGEVADELPFWLEMMDGATTALPRIAGDVPADGAGTAGEALSVSRVLDREQTAALLRSASDARVRPVEIMLAALGRTLAEWSGAERVAIDIEGHGREPFAAGLDPTRAVGWFTSIHPLVIDSGEPLHVLRELKNRYRTVPGGGLGYGLLRYVRDADEITGRLRELPERSVLFNYLGRFHGGLRADGGWQVAAESTGIAQEPSAPRRHALEVSALVADGRLQVRWTYSPRLHHEETIGRLADAFADQIGLLLDRVRQEPAALLTPVDFPLVKGIRQAGIDRLVASMGEPEDLYPLSPLQQGMLFHLLYDPDGGVNLEQVTCRLKGRLDVAAFREAWQDVVARHAVLRTSFYWREHGESLQAVHAQVAVPWQELDWTDLTTVEQDARLADFLREDRARGFEPGQAPLMRIVLIRRGPDVVQLVWSHHHLLLDGWSLSRVLQEVVAAYRARLERRAPQLPPVRPYRDYIGWLGRQDLNTAEDYWRRTMAGFDTPTPLPAASEPERTVGGMATEVLELSVAATKALGDFAQRHHLTVGTLVQAAWALFLQRHSNETEVVFGTVVAGRPADLPGSEEIVGQFINTQPVRVPVPPGKPTLAWLHQVQDILADGRQYEFTPLLSIQGWTDVPRGTQLFETVVVFENYLAERIAGIDESDTDLDDLVIEQFRGLEQTNYPLTLIVAPGARLRLQLMYDAGRYSQESAWRFNERLRTFLEGLPSRYDLPLGELPLLPESELSLVLDSFNDTAVVLPLERTLPELFEDQAARTPDAIAVREGELQLTYRELNTRANQLAHHLINTFDPRPEDRIALALDRTTDLVTAILATFKTGAAYLPLNPHHTTERLTAQLTDATPLCLLTHTTHHSGWNGWPGPAALPVLALDRPVWNGQKAVDPVGRGLRPDHLAYLIYTSGSTGTPKAAQVEHRGMINHLHAKIRDLGLAAGDNLAATASPTFDIHVWQLLAPLITGATTHLLPDTVAHDPGGLITATDTHHLTVLQIVPSLLSALLTHLDTRTTPPPPLTTLRYLILTGEALPPDLAAAWLTRYPHIPALNAYGPTECSDDVTHHTLTTPPHPDTTHTPIGTALPNTRLYLLDTTGQPVPLGTPGHLHIGGTPVGRGDLNRPALTAQHFIPDPYAPTPGARLYATGDLARQHPDGTLTFLGRTDHQIKLRGYRIEPGEIEHTLRTHPAIDQAHIHLHQPTPTDQRLIAYLTLHPHHPQPTPEELTTHLTQTLPHYMTPATYTILKTRPHTPHGKIDRKALPQPDPTPTHTHTPPQTPTQATLTHLWQNTLNHPHIGIHDNFFTLGGHSLLAMQVIARLPEELGVELPLRALFEAPTVAGFAARVEQARADSDTPAPTTPPLRPVGRDSELPLSFAQQRLWFLDQLEPGGSVYNLPMAARLSGPLNIAALHRSLHALTQRHETLRTTITSHRGEPHQHITAVARTVLPVIDLSALAADARHATARRLAAAEAQRPFNLAQGPLLRMSLLRTAPDQHVLLLTVHHIASDGWSNDILLRELGELYRAHAGNTRPDLPALPLQYPDFAVWQRTLLSGDTLEAELQHWRTELAGAPTLLELPTDRPRPAVQTYRGAHHITRWPAELTENLRRLGHEAGATFFMTLLAAYTTLLYRWSGQDDILVGTPTASRTRPELEHLIGFFANTLTLRTELHGNPTFRQLLDRVRESTLRSYAHQDLPFEKLVEALEPDRSLSHNPLIQTLLVLQNTPRSADPQAWSGLTLTPFDDAPQTTAKFDLTLTAYEEKNGIALSLEYNTDLFTADTIEHLLTRLETLTRHATTHPDTRLHDLPLLTDTEQHDLTTRFNDTAVVLPLERTLPELFEDQAARTPDAIAVREGELQLTYRELNTRANQLAHHLINTFDPRPEDRIALALDRTTDLVTAILATFKTGAAYLPLNPHHTTERLTAQLTDATPLCLLTHTTHHSGWNGWPGPAALPVLALDRPVWNGQKAVDPVGRGLRPDHLAYLIYTSGSTGTPKAAQVEHRGMINHLHAKIRDLGLAAGDNLAATASPTFDIHVWQLLAPLITGATTHLLPDTVAHDPGGLITATDTHHLTVLQIVPSLLSALLTHLDTRTTPPPPLTTLRYLILTGEALPPDLAAAWLTRYPHIPALNAYGPTECSDDVTHHTLTTPPHPDTTHTPIGTALPNTRLYLLDTTGQPVPLGTPGHLHIGGTPVGRGYLNRPALTAQHFIPDPYAPTPGARLYATGDRARQHPDGTLTFLGRTDHQIKLRGYRIEPGEIEHTLRTHPAIDQAHIHLHQPTPTDQRLIAYLTLPPHHPQPTPEELTTHLTQTLPHYMTPATYTILKTRPLPPHGKIDRKALPQPDPTPTHTHTPPQTPTQATLTHLWQNTLNHPHIGIHDNFFTLGGHSLLALRLADRIKEAFGGRLLLADLYQHPTPAAMAARIDSAGAGRHDWPSSVVPLRATGSRPPLFCIHPKNGTVFCFAGLAQTLEAERPVFGVQAHGLDPEVRPLESIEELAAAYLRDIVKVQPQGPYLLSGYSLGGTIAYELARQLAAQGREVASLIMLDSYPVLGDDSPTLAEFEAMDDAAFLVHQFGGALPVNEEHLRSLTPDARMLHLLDLAAEAGLESEHMDLKSMTRYVDIVRAHTRAALTYRPLPYSGPVLLLRCDDLGPDAGPDPRDNWSALIGESLIIQDVPGSHMTMLDPPNLTTVAAHISKYVADLGSSGKRER
ncbi:amino acid adenylation domain-containing protein [Streptomyces mirabilis]|uniref:amino acid adenylation domain-containing protein n=1 Tax=Streptomyces mirabilis TaxID=68239 RepID=UPI0036DFC2F4